MATGTKDRSKPEVYLSIWQKVKIEWTPWRVRYSAVFTICVGAERHWVHHSCSSTGLLCDQGGLYSLKLIEGLVVL